MNPGRSGSKYSLTSASNVTSPDGPVLTVYVGFADYAAIKMLPNLCSLPTNTFLSFPRCVAHIHTLVRPAGWLGLKHSTLLHPHHYLHTLASSIFSLLW